MVTGAVWPGAPVASRTVKPMLVPAVMFVDQLKDVLVRPGYC